MWITLLESKVPFEHELIDLGNKPAEFRKLSPTGLVPLLELDDGSVITESVPIARHVATRGNTALLPPGDAATIDEYIDLWTGRVEPLYYAVLRATSVLEVRRATASLIEALAAIEERLTVSRMRRG